MSLISELSPYLRRQYQSVLDGDFRAEYAPMRITDHEGRPITISIDEARSFKKLHLAHLGQLPRDDPEYAEIQRHMEGKLFWKNQREGKVFYPPKWRRGPGGRLMRGKNRQWRPRGYNYPAVPPALPAGQRHATSGQ